MKPLKQRLDELEKDIRITITGIGSIGKGLVYQSHSTKGITPVGIADIKIEKAIDCAEWLNLDYRIVKTESELNECINSGNVAVTDDGSLLGSSELVDVYVESSNAIFAGALHAEKAIRSGIHVVMMNYEADLMYGPYLYGLAKEEGVVYTSADGDQPTVIKGLVDELDAWGFDLVMAGNIKGYLDRYTNPVKIEPEALKRSLDPKMCSSYTDGSKLCVEMAVLANALNLRTHIPGMYGKRIKSVYDIFNVYNFQEIYKDKKPVVDYILGAEPKGGVFAVGYNENKFQQYTLDWFPPNMGPGPFYLFYRPYHLGHIEGMACIAEAYLDNTARLEPKYGMKTNVFTYAKTDLKKGDTVDGMGGFAAYGLIENINQQSEEGIPICLADNVTLNKDVKKDERINLADTNLDKNDPSFSLYRQSLKF